LRSLGALGDRARIAVVALAVGRLDHVARDNQGRFVHERIDVGGRGVRHQLHVGRLNALPASDGGAVEGVAILELFEAEGGNRHADVLFLAADIGEAEVDEFDHLFLDQLDYILWCHE
jgi:hypothetical protein